MMTESVGIGTQWCRVHFCFHKHSSFISLLPNKPPHLSFSAQQSWALASAWAAFSPLYSSLPSSLNQDTRSKIENVSHVKWEVMKRKEVPKNVKLIPRAPLVLIWDTIRVVTVAYSTSGRRKRRWCYWNASDSEQGVRRGKKGRAQVAACPQLPTHPSRTRWGPCGWRRTCRARRARPSAAGRSAGPASPAGGSPTPSCRTQQQLHHTARTGYNSQESRSASGQSLSQAASRHKQNLPALNWGAAGIGRALPSGWNSVCTEKLFHLWECPRPHYSTLV